MDSLDDIIEEDNTFIKEYIVSEILSKLSSDYPSLDEVILLTLRDRAGLLVERFFSDYNQSPDSGLNFTDLIRYVEDLLIGTTQVQWEDTE